MAWTIVCAGGAGHRFGQAKQYVELGDKRLIDHAVANAAEASDFVVIGAPAADVDDLRWAFASTKIKVIPGGVLRSDTVRAALAVIPSSAGVKITCRLVAGQEPGKVAEAIRHHLEAQLPTGYLLDVKRHGPGTKAFSIDPDLPALAIAETLLGEMMGAKALRVAMGATIPIGSVFKEHLGVGTIFFSFSTSDEDYHAPNEFFRLENFSIGQIAWARLFQRLGMSMSGE